VKLFSNNIINIQSTKSIIKVYQQSISWNTLIVGYMTVKVVCSCL